MRRNESIRGDNEDYKIETQEEQRDNSEGEGTKEQTIDEDIVSKLQKIRQESDCLKELFGEKDIKKRKGHLIYEPCYVITYLTLACSFGALMVFHLKGYI